jgi:hypothetical protein
VASSCEHGTKLSGSIKGGEFLDLVTDNQVLKKDCASWSLLVTYSVSQSVSQSDLLCEAALTSCCCVYDSNTADFPDVPGGSSQR